MGDSIPQPYYLIGQWRLQSDRQLRAFVDSARGTLHLARVGDDGSELTPEEIAECSTHIFPDLLRRLQHFTDVPLAFSSTPAIPSDQERTERLGELLIRDGLITDAQLEVALRLQASTPSYVPLGHILVARKFLSRKTLTMALRRYRKSARLGDVLLKAGHVTAAQLEEGLELQRGTPLRIGQMLVRLGWLRETTMREALCMQLNVNFVDVDAIVIDRDLAGLISESFARRYSVVPLIRADDVVVVAMDDPARADVIGELERSLGLQIEAVTSLASKLRAAMDRLYNPAGSRQVGASDGSIFVGPIRDYAVAELVMRAARRG